MAQTYNKLKIDIKEPVTDIITAKQNDSNSRFLDVYLYDGGVPIDLTGHEVRIYMLKADGTEVFNNGEITNATAGRCQFELTDQALGAYGKLLCEISIWYDNVQILTSQTFGIDVVKNLRTDGSIESSNEYGALVVLYQNLYEAFDLITTMVEQFGEPGEVADEASIETFWQMLEYLYSVNNNALANSSTQGVLDLIGSTGDTGGSETAGTLMAKMNTLLENNAIHGYKEITAAGTTNWTCPKGVSIVYVVAQGGQGGGGGGQGGVISSATVARNGGGGGSGGTAPVISAILPVTPNTTYTIVVGAGGTGGTGGAKGTTAIDASTSLNSGVGGNGGNGGQTKFGNIFTTNGGSGGKGANHNGKQNSANINAAGGGAGSINALVAKNIVLNIIDGLAGNAGTDGTYSNTPACGAGGSAKTSQTGLKSGAGGAGGQSVANSGTGNTDGSAGGAGQQGYLKFIW